MTNKSMRELHNRVTFTKNGTSITGQIIDFYYDKHKNVMVSVKDDGGYVHCLLESELD